MKVNLVFALLVITCCVLPSTLAAQQGNLIRDCRRQVAQTTNAQVADINARRDRDLDNGNFTIVWDARRPNGRTVNGFCEADPRTRRIVRVERERPNGGGGGNGGGAAVRPPGNTEFTGLISNRASGKCIDLDISQGTQRNDRTNVHQYGCGDVRNQQWELISVGNREYAILSVESGRVLDVEGESRSDGANVYQFEWHGGPNQRWRGQGGAQNLQLINVNSRKCLEIPDGNRSDGANIIQWSCTGRPNQRWRVGARQQ